MAVKFQYNKVSMQQLQKELKIRSNALPTLKSKEAYLRITIKRQKQLLKEQKSELQARLDEIGKNQRLWAEFPKEIITFESVSLREANIAGIKVPSLDDISYSVSSYSPFFSPSWYTWGIDVMKSLTRAIVEITIMEDCITLLEYARKKTTQKVNLYEKVQIPDFSASILKIKRYLEDVENLDKAAQKITKSRQAEGAAV